VSWKKIITRRWPDWRGDASRLKLVIIPACHILAVCAPFTYRPLECFLFIASGYLILQFGLVIGYHRLLSHKSFVCQRWLKRLLGLFGTLAIQNGPISWVAMHRFHHRVSDRHLDPHTPLFGRPWAHLFWMFFEHPVLSLDDERLSLAPDIAEDAFLLFCESRFLVINAVAAVLVFTAGLILGGPGRGFSFLAWIVGLRTICLWHITSLTNSVGHSWGYRNFDTRDNSCNVWLLGLIALGDGWHNNHHAFPACAAHGRRWFEFDLTYRVILILQVFNLVWSVKRPVPISFQRRSVTKTLSPGSDERL
jgi:fatty-acid desaturase